MGRHATINRVYRTVWSEVRGAWIAVAECARGRGKRSVRAMPLAALLGALAVAPHAFAGPPVPTQLPTGGAVVGGAASIGQSGAVMNIQQGSQRAAINWQTFNVGADAKVNFQQPSAAAVTLNRVLDTQASQIYGNITANGQVFLSNPNGVYFSPSASVDVGGLVATTHGISTADFMAGKNTFTRDGATGSVVNDGELKAALGGYIALLAPEVRNNGIVLAQAGTVAMAAGDTIELQFENSRSLMGVLVSASALETLVENRSAVRAPGGLIILSAQAANQLQGGVVRNSGQLEATGLVSRGGRIVLDASGLVDNGGSIDASGAPGGSITIRADRMVSGGAIHADGGGGQVALTLVNGLVETSGALTSASGGGGSITVDGGAGRIYTSGRYDADGVASDRSGGRVVLTAHDVTLMGASVSASGPAGGGTILVGGGFHGADEAVRNATTTTIGRGVTLKADATVSGHGGKVVVWSDEKTVFSGAITASGGAVSGNGGSIEVSGKQSLYMAGTAIAPASHGTAGDLLLDPKDIYIEDTLSGQLEFLDPHPTGGGTFGATTTVLKNAGTPTGYVVVTNPTDNLGASDSGAAYLFRQSDQALISTLYGTHANDKVGFNTSGSPAAVTLANGNFVVLSNQWDNGKGAATFGNGSTGWGASPLAVSSANSLVGSSGAHNSSQGYSVSDGVGSTSYFTALSNGNYLIGSPGWSDSRGALTFGSGTTGVSGVVSSTNSLVGSTPLSNGPSQFAFYKYGDQVGGSVTLLDNGNYVLANRNWNKGVGAVTFGTATAAPTGVVGAANSLVGDSSRSDATGNGSGTDKVGQYFQALDGSKFLVYSADWFTGRGQVTWFDGVTGVTGLVSSANSLVGNANDYLAVGGITTLGSNNAYVIRSFNWNNSTGAATWVPYATNVKDVVVATNGVHGNATGDSIGSAGLTVLANNDYVLSSPNFNGVRGASTLVDGTTGKTKVGQGSVVSASNSVVGSTANDSVGSYGIVPLAGNGNYLVLSPYWANGGNTKAGAVTWSSGSSPTVGAVSSVNSLVGSAANDRIGSYQYTYYQYGSTTPYLQEASSVTALANGNYAVASPMWNGTRGAVTWGNGSTGATVSGVNTISAANSLIGSNAADFIGGFVAPVDVITNTLTNSTSHYDAIGNGITALANGSFVVASDYWRNGSALRAGAVTWSDGTGSPTLGAVSSGNSLVGTVQDDRVGSARYNANGVKRLLAGYDVNGQQLYTSDYVVYSARWNNGGIVDAGAVTWGSGTSPLTGTITSGNSVLGEKTYTDTTAWTILPLAVHGNYLIQNPLRNIGGATDAGAVTFVDGSTGRLADYAAQSNTNVVSAANSLVGSQADDQVGNYYIDSLYVYDTATKTQQFTGNYVVLSTNWANGANAAAGAVTWGSGASGVAGTISDANSILGTKAGDYLGQGTTYATYASLPNGNYVVANPTLDVGGVVNAGAVALVDGSTGRLANYAAQGNRNVMSSANSLVGSHTDDFVGNSVYAAYNYDPNYSYATGGFFVFSDLWSCLAGAATYVDGAASASPIAGVVGASNSAVGNPNNRFFGGLGTYPFASLSGTDTAVVTFAGDNGHVVLASTAMPGAPAMTIPGALLFGDAPGATQSMGPDWIASMLMTGTNVTLQASNDIVVKSGIDATGGTAGGSLSMSAGRSIAILGNVVTGNRNLSLVANDSLANGVVDAYRDAGIATISMGKNLQGQDAVIDAGTGTVSMLMAAGSDKTHHMAGSISLNSITAGRISVVNQGDGAGTVGDLPDLSPNCCGFDLGYRAIGSDVVLNSGAVLHASGNGSAVTLAALGNFRNDSGNGAGGIVLTDPTARWLVYANAPGGSSYGNLDSGNTALWNTTYAGNTDPSQGGNRYVFAFQPSITVGTQDVSKTYGEDLTTGTTLVDRVVSLSGAQAAVSGAYLGDTVATALSGGITASSSGSAANAGVAGGPYAITVDLSGATGNNGYAVTLGSNTPRTITVQAKALTASLGTVTKTYDGFATATLVPGDYLLAGLVGSESFTIGKASGTFNASDVTATLVSTTLASGDFTAGSGTLASNYLLPTTASGTGSIQPKTLTASLVNVSKTYDATAAVVLAASNFSLGGFVGSQSATVSQTAGLFNSADVASATSVSATLGTGQFTAGGGTSLANYVLPTSASSAASITPVTLTASLTGTITKVYDGNTDAVLGAGNFNLGGFVGSQSAAITQTAGSYNSAHVASASSATATLGSGDYVAGSGTLLSNYLLPTSATGAASITAKTLSAAVTGTPTRDYDATSVATLAGSNFALTGLVSGDAVSVTQTAGSYDSVNVGARTVSVTLAGGNFSAGGGTQLTDYVLPTSASGSGQIGVRAITLTAPSVSKVYDGGLGYSTTSGDLSSLSGALVGSDSVTSATLAYLNKNVGAGNKAVTLNAVTINDGNNGANYSVSLAGNSTSSITARTLNVTAAGQNRVYDTSTNAVVTLGDDRVSGDALDLSNTSASFGDKNAGVGKTVTVSGIGFSGTDAGNYVLSGPTTTTTATITPAPLQVTGVTAQQRAYDTTLAVALGGAASVTPLGSDVVALGGSGVGSYADKNAGVDKPVTVSGFTISDPNYTLVQPAGVTGTVTPAILALSGLTVASTKTYDGTTIASLSGTPIVTGLGGEVVTVGGAGTGQFADKNVGTGKPITVSGFLPSDPNYAISQQPGLTGDIAPATVSVGGVAAIDRLFDGSTAIALSGTPTIGRFGADAVTVAGTPSASVADPAAGADKPVAVTGYLLTGADAPNYVLLQPQGLTVDIVAAVSEPVLAPPPVLVTPTLVPPPLLVPPPVVVAPPQLPVQSQSADLSAPPLSLVAAAGAVPGFGAPVTQSQVALTPGITVALVNEPSAQQPGQVAVTVPREVIDAGNGFAFPLPRSIIETAVARGAALQVTALDGSGLPSWISYSADSGSFVVTRVPPGGLPLQILIVVDGQRFVLVVSEAS